MLSPLPEIPNKVVEISGRPQITSSSRESFKPQETVRRITFVYFDAGGGHRAAADALRSAIRDADRPWKVAYLNLQELLDEIDLIRKLTGYRVQDVYNLMLEKGWTLGAAQLLPPFHTLIRLHHHHIVALLERVWRDTRPGMVVSLIPNFNAALGESIRNTLPTVPFVTILTDLADYPPHFWIERESEYLICGTEHAARQALAMGHPPDRAFRTSGMILNPSFYSASEIDRFKQRQFLGLEAGRLTGIVMFGGRGSRVMLKIARRLGSFENLQLIFICGRNQRLQSQLRRMHFKIPVLIEGFTQQVGSYMQISDFFIGKPGPGSVSEALQMGLPVVVEHNAWTLPQERFNADWIRQNEVGIVIGDFRQVNSAVGRLAEPTVLHRYQANARALKNCAVFEIPEILKSILEEKRGSAPIRTATESKNCIWR